MSAWAWCSAVQRDFVDQPQTDNGPAWIGVPLLWNGSPNIKGEGIVAGVIDTGINFSSPSFACCTGGDGYIHTNPRGQFYGVRDPDSTVYNASFTCTKKPIGAWDFADDYEPADGPAGQRRSRQPHRQHDGGQCRQRLVGGADLCLQPHHFRCCAARQPHRL